MATNNALNNLTGLQSIQIFTANDTWMKPAGINRVYVQLVGGGGGSGGTAATGGSEVAESACGGAGGYSAKLIDVSSISSETVTIGTGGAAGTAGNNAGGTGGTTSFGAHCSATGGAGGAGGAATATTSSFRAAGGAGGVGSGGDINIQGNSGSNGRVVTLPLEKGSGGASFFSGAPTYSNSANTPTAGYLYGGGATGSWKGVSVAAQTGSAGAAGVVIVYEFS